MGFKKVAVRNPSETRWCPVLSRDRQKRDTGVKFRGAIRPAPTRQAVEAIIVVTKKTRKVLTFPISFLKRGYDQIRLCGSSSPGCQSRGIPQVLAGESWPVRAQERASITRQKICAKSHAPNPVQCNRSTTQRFGGALRWNYRTLVGRHEGLGHCRPDSKRSRS